MTTAFEVTSARGSTWHRWDPHLHTPGTALNDQYTGTDPWGDFLQKIEQSDPPIRALGITDYYSIDNYLKVVAQRMSGRLSGVGLVFPNVEIRLSIETNKAGAINLHLLFCPAVADHVARIRHFLTGLEMIYLGEKYRCTREDFVRLGRVHKPSLPNDDAAYEEGATQFKVNFNDVKDCWEKSEWARANCLIAVSGGSHDGTSGLQNKDGGWAATRQEIERFAHVIFSANGKQIAFYLGQGAASPDELTARWGGRKPCLHGSDAHDSASVGNPDLDRYCWLNGDLTFETLRCAAIEPEGRVHIGPQPPRGALPGNCMKVVSVTNAPWMNPSAVPLNSGMVAIIGARGSGKTALADFIATGTFGVSARMSTNSFLTRAREFLEHSSVKVSWEAGQETENGVAHLDAEQLLDEAHVQYLSQQFVEQLCSSEGLTDDLMKELQRAIFDSHAVSDRMGTDNFPELLALRLEAAREARERQQRALERVVHGIAGEQTRKDGQSALIKDRDEKQRLLDKDIADKKLLVPKGQELRARRAEVVADAAEAKQRQVDVAKRKLQALNGLRADVLEVRTNFASEWLVDAKERRPTAGLSESDWNLFKITFGGDVDALLEERIRATSKDITSIEGPAATDPPINSQSDPLVPLIADSAPLAQQSLRLLERERDRLRRLVGVDEQNSRKLKILSEKIAKAETQLAKIKEDIERANKSDDLLKELRSDRRAAYLGVFNAVLEEERELAALYAPLKTRLANGQGAIGKLSFSVRRVVDLAGWASRGEDLLDLRKGPFRKGDLQLKAESALAKVWNSGGAEAVADAMEQFVGTNSTSLLAHMPTGVGRREWARDVSAWLYSTEHIEVGYGLQYDSVNIEQLSPGTRGIVLLLLYLAIDASDDRPLIIDQPEENLDPQSVFAELVPLFREAKKRRQIVIVTHNANLVVNTDVDQVIVASCGPHRPGQLPEISYFAGGLENPSIRTAVCQILEGGEKAFKERARRLRVSI